MELVSVSLSSFGSVSPCRLDVCGIVLVEVPKSQNGSEGITSGPPDGAYIACSEHGGDRSIARHSRIRTPTKMALDV